MILVMTGAIAMGCGSGATTPTGTGGAGGTSATGGAGGHGGAGCIDPAMQCPDPGTECVVATCDVGACGTTNVADGKATTAGQIAGDCKAQVCDGAGATKIIDDDADPSDDMNACTADTCVAGANVHTPIEGACADNGGKVCALVGGPKEGQCVQCNVDADCASPQVCDPVNGSNTCVDPSCTDAVKNGSETDVDCGGSCAPCPNTKTCAVAADCQSGACISSVCAPCADDADCSATDFCDKNIDGGTCTPDLTQGAACSGASQCESGECVDGFCCDTACDGACQACSAAAKGQGVDGACGDVVAGTDPDADCADETAATCGKTGVCNGSGACELYTAMTVCQAPSCAGGVQQNADMCDGAGTCVDAGSVNCGNYACDPMGVTCLSACVDDSACAAGNYCSMGACVPKLADGGACTGANACSSGQCVDGVCCNVACGGTCQACNIAGNVGTCSNIASGQDPANECAGSYSCNGAGACQVCGDGVVQAGEACDDGNTIDTDACTNNCTVNSCGANLALTATASISSGGSGASFGPDQMNNGIGEGTCSWAWLDNNTAASGAWAQLTWAQPVTIRSFYIETENAAGGGTCNNPAGRNVKSATVQYWNGSAWVTSTTFTGKVDDVQIDLPAAVTTTQLRIYDVTTDAGNGNSIIYEWHVYGGAGCIPPP